MLNAKDFIQHLKDEYTETAPAPMDAYILQQISYELDQELDHLSTSDSVIIKLRYLTSALQYQVFPQIKPKVV